jgi:hypothetical protein
VTPLVDDYILSGLLRKRDVEGVNTEDVYTTGLWYFRLCQAVFRSQASGVLSRPFQALGDLERRGAEDRLLTLPESIKLLNLRELAPLMGRQAKNHSGLNLLAREVLAAATILEATVFLSASSPHLEQALMAEGLQVRHSSG